MTNGEKFKEVFGFGADGSRVIAVNATWWDSEFQNSKPITKRVPAADLRPVVRGHWIDGTCSNCGFFTDVVMSRFFSYCPNCGADMMEEG
jgi:hypothetical protein